MDAENLIGEFHIAIAREVAIYTGLLGAIMAAGWLANWIVDSRTILVFATAATLLGGAMATAGYVHRGKLQERIAADVAAHRADPVAARHRFVKHYQSAESGWRFAKMALLWSALIAMSLAGIKFLSGPYAHGVALALLVLSTVTLALGGSAFRREIAYAAVWNLR